MGFRLEMRREREQEVVVLPTPPLPVRNIVDGDVGRRDIDRAEEEEEEEEGRWKDLGVVARGSVKGEDKGRSRRRRGRRRALLSGMGMVGVVDRSIAMSSGLRSRRKLWCDFCFNSRITG